MILRYIILLVLFKFVVANTISTTTDNDSSYKKGNTSSSSNEDDISTLAKNNTYSSQSSQSSVAQSSNEDSTNSTTSKNAEEEENNTSKQEDPEMDAKSYKMMEPYMKDDFNKSDIFIHMEPEMVTLRMGKFKCSRNISCTLCINLSYDGFKASKQKLCISISFLSLDFKVNLQVNLDGGKITDQSVSGKNPPKVCFPINKAIACLKFSDIYFPGKNVHFCADMEFKYKKFEAFDLHLNCFKFGEEKFQYMAQGERAIGPQLTL